MHARWFAWLGAVAAPALAHAEPAPAAPIEVTGYVQVDGRWDQSSQDAVAPDGSSLNEDVLVVRRGRVQLARAWEHAAAEVELDANTVSGAAVGAHRAQVSLFAPGDAPGRPLVALTAGLVGMPFGVELPQSSGQRLFMERSAGSRALFPGETDIGAVVSGAAREFRFAIGAFAGEPVTETHHISDPNAAKDVIARVGVDAQPSPAVTVVAGVSLVAGTGFHAGTPATQSSVQWIDYNENGQLDPGELVGVTGSAATPSQNFRRWAVGADVAVGVQLCPVGWLRLAAEVTVASNLDRGLYVADPVAAGTDARELGAVVAAIQDLGPTAYAGLRVDYYNPNLDALDARVGQLIPVDESLTTFAALVGARLPWHARASLEYDLIRDHLARDATGVPTDLANNRLTVRLQVDL